MVRRLHDQAFSQTRRDPLLTPAALQKAALSGGSPGWRHERGSGGAAVVGLVSADWPARRAPCIILEQSDLRAERTRYAGSGMGGFSRAPSSSRAMVSGHRRRRGQRPARGSIQTYAENSSHSAARTALGLYCSGTVTRRAAITPGSTRSALSGAETKFWSFSRNAHNFATQRSSLSRHQPVNCSPPPAAAVLAFCTLTSRSRQPSGNADVCRSTPSILKP
jgi:hypothetical protein